MDVIIIFNGLGNQMSQYSFYLAKKKINPSTYAISFCRDHNGLELESVFGISFDASVKQRFLHILFRLLLTDKFGAISGGLRKVFNFFNIKIQKENYDYAFKSEYLNPSKGVTFYYGGWHAPAYFKEVEQKLSNSFKFIEPSDSKNQKIVNKIKNMNSISIHIRRGDYINSANIDLFGGVCTLDYYQDAINLLVNQIKDCHFFIFSNDMKWVQDNLKLDNVTYVDHNCGVNSWKDMYLMSLCNHNIIANSTFSWWGAWLNKNQRKIVISPNKFLNDDIYTEVYPSTWTKLIVQ